MLGSSYFDEKTAADRVIEMQVDTGRRVFDYVVKLARAREATHPEGRDEVMAQIEDEDLPINV